MEQFKILIEDLSRQKIVIIISREIKEKSGKNVESGRINLDKWLYP